MSLSSNGISTTPFYGNFNGEHDDNPSYLDDIGMFSLHFQVPNPDHRAICAPLLPRYWQWDARGARRNNRSIASSAGPVRALAFLSKVGWWVSDGKQHHWSTKPRKLRIKEKPKTKSNPNINGSKILSNSAMENVVDFSSKKPVSSVPTSLCRSTVSFGISSTRMVWNLPWSS